jgi:hypothetical protein
MDPAHDTRGFVAWFPLLFIGVWLLVCALISLTGGWHRLAARFPASSGIDGEAFRFASMSLGSGLFPVRYRNTLFVMVGRSGLGLSVFFPFRVLHPPLFIPWSAVETVRREPSWLMNPVAVYIRGFDKRLLFHGRAGKRILETFIAQAAR